MSAPVPDAMIQGSRLRPRKGRDFTPDNRAVVRQDLKRLQPIANQIARRIRPAHQSSGLMSRSLKKVMPNSCAAARPSAWEQRASE
jgi:hypothetical protein